jgi:uncharacterized membrane protein YbhN (UPF0104 family)
MRGSLGSARLWVQLAITAGFLVLLGWRVDISEALATLPDANWLWVLPGLAVFTISKVVHAARWRVFLGNHRNLSLAGLTGIFLVSNMANAVLLLRAGDILRIQTTAQRYNISRSELTATVIVVETLLDGLTFVLLVAVAFSFGAIPGVLRATFWGMAGLALIGVLLGVVAARWVNADSLERIYPFRWLSQDAIASVKTLAAQFIDGMRTMRDLNLAVLLIMMTANFAVAIPVTPSGIGPYEVATQELIVQLGADRALATGYAIGIHLTFIIWITLTGLAAMWLMRLTPDEIFYIAQEQKAQTQPETP